MQFEPIFKPKTVAVIGASDRPESVGYAVMNNMLNENFKGTVYPINGRKPELFGKKCYAKIGQVPEKVDLAVIAVPAKVVPSVCIECGEAGVKGLIIITAGFAEAGEEGLKMCAQIQETCQKYNMRMIGPNCLGIINPTDGVNASFASVMPEAGGVAFISQSGALCTAILDWARDQHVGFSYFVSIGSSIDTDYADLFEYFALDDKVTSILMYIESVKDAKKFVKRAKEFALKKPILLLKAGKSSEGAAAAMSHTGSLAGNDAVYDAVFDRCGCIRVDSICDLWDCAHVLATQTVPQNNRLCIITNAGGPGVISTDRLVSVDGKLAKLSPETMEALNASLSPFWSHSNP
ncbi:MAG: CoA-binding protein, partial [Clostridia bacterium]|nr:CoA-binding protein [Clostridia bacterium]